MTARAPAFWSKPPGLAAWGLWPASLVWGIVAGLKMRRTPEARAAVPVICVGNLTAGGAGKTPAVIAICNRIRMMGRQPGVLLRGYGGRLQGPLEVLPKHTAADVGDEALLHARSGVTVIAADRAAGARLLGRNCDVIVMDDGFQNPALAKNLSLVVVDTEAGIGNGFVMPAGPLRAPLGAQLSRASSIIAIGTAPLPTRLDGPPVIRASLVPDARFRALAGRRVLAFSGIGRPEKFFSMLEDVGAVVVGRKAFPDHHQFDKADADNLVAMATAERLQLVTTEKDAARLVGQPALDELATRTSVVGVSLVFTSEAAFRTLLSETVARQSRDGA